MNVKLFVKSNCPRCPAAKRACEGLQPLEVFDIDEIDGLAEAAFYSVLSTPSIVVVDAKGSEVASWRGEVPDRRAIDSLLAN